MRLYCLLTLLAISAFAAEPVVKTVPWVASDPAIPHDTFAYKSTTLKGTSSLQGPNIRAVWDFGDGSAPVSSSVEDGYNVSAAHAYYGKPGDTFAARLTVTDTTTGESGSAIYLVALREKTLQTEVNIAIDDGLWYLHRSMTRTGIGGVPAGDWTGPCPACEMNGATLAWNVLAFERHGHLESGSSSDPYTETVARGVAMILASLRTSDAIAEQAVIDAIRAANSPNATAVVGALSSRTYREILFLLTAANKTESTASAATETGTVLGALAEPAGVPEDALRAILDRQDRLGFWYGHSGAVSASVETAQSLLSLSKTPVRDAGANSALNVSAEASVTNTGFLFSRATATYNGDLTVKNISAAPIVGPVTVGILGLTSGVTLANSSGTFNGAPYVTVTGSNLDPGQTATVPLRFTNPGNAVINFNRVAYSGAFPPAALSVACPASSGTTGVAYNSALDANGGVRSYTYSTTGSLPSGLLLNATTGAVTGTPDTPGSVNFTAVVTDSAAPSTQTTNTSCSISISNGTNSAPAASPQTIGTNEDVPVTITLTGSDPESANLTFSIVSGPTSGSLGAITPIIATSASVQYTPGPNFNGAASFTFKVNDGTQDSPAATVTINVAAVNDAPSFAKGPDQSISQNAPAQTVAGWATAISAGPADESGQTVTFNITGNTNPGLFSAAPAISPTGTLTYTPAAGQSGSATITVTLSDNGGTANGGVNTSAPQTFGINIAVVNQVPSFTKGSDQTVLEDAGAQTVAGWATAISPGPPAEASQAVSFNITGNTNAALFSAGPAVSSTGTLTYTPTANANGSATITVVAQDNGGTANGGVDTSASQSFVINITAVNDAPSFTKGADQTVNEDAAAQTVAGWATAIAAGPADESGQTVTFNITGNSNAALFSVAPAISATGTLTYTLAANASGSATITTTLTDNGGTANGGVNSSAPQTFVINVTGVNDAPSFTKGADQTVNEDSGPQTVVGWATAISPGPASEAGQTLTFNVTGNTNAALFSAGPAISATGTLTFTPAANANGSATITITLQDNGGTANGGLDTSAPQQFVINVTAVNDAPSFTKGADETVLEDTGLHTVAGWATAISAGGPDESGQAVTFNITGNTNPSLFSVAPAIAANGTLTYTLAANQFGSSTITVTLSDSGGGTNTSPSQQFVINVSNVNDAPSFTKGANQTVNEDAGAQTVVAWATAISPGPNEAGQAVSFSITSNTNAALFSAAPAVSPSGTLTFTPAANANGTATITLRIVDNGGTANGGVDASATQSFTINVTPVNDPPAVTAKTFVVQPNIQIIVGAPGLLTGTTDPNDPENVSPVFTVTAASVSSGTLVFAANGSFSYDPAAGNTADVQLNYTVCDNGTPGSACTNATAILDLAGPTIWFVNNNAAGCTTLAANCGRLNNPFSSLAAFNALNNGVGNNPNDNQNIFLYESATPYSGAVTLRTGQKLIGQDATASLATITGATPPVNSISLPVMNSANGTVTNITSTVTLNTNATVRGLQINSSTSTGMNDPAAAITGVSVSEVSVVSTTGTAVLLSNTGGTISLSKVSSNGASTGLSLTSTTGSFTVTGDGRGSNNGSGGEIQNSTGAGITLSSAAGVSLSYMTIQNSADDGILGNNVAGLTLDRVNVTNNGNSATDEGIELNNVSGAVSITNAVVVGNAHNNVKIDNNSAPTLTSYTVTNSSFSSTSLTNGNHGMLVEIRGTSQLTTASLTGNTFSNNNSLGLQVLSGDSATISAFNVTGNTFSDTGSGHSQEIGVDFAAGHTSNMTYQFLNNTLTGHNAQAFNTFTGAGAGTGGSLRGTIQGNTIGNPAVIDSGSRIGNGMRININGGANARILVNNNTLHQIPTGRGIEAIARNGAGGANFTITNNTVTAPTGTAGTACGAAGTLCPLAPIYVQANAATIPNRACSAVSANTAYNPLSVPGGAGGEFSVLLQQSNGATLTYEGNVAQTALQNLTAANPAAVTRSVAGTVTVVPVGTCLLP